ncbi:bilirubin oxidase [Granulicella sp. WH15]|uniref:multicopper oxidase family protein n=1 Tax=Granulicella sp. WH15 TaxID=2602070 RepID=UPI001366D468|nr:multicopper oxidase domain-containing protein [Granulicella sp. WH15]QHN03948.1 bilirubin oxidase [Granulicella sp. WH15]
MAKKTNSWTRRRLLARGAAAAVLPLLRKSGLAQMSGMSMPSSSPRTRRTLDARKLTPFVDPLPLPQLLRPVDRRSSPAHNATDAPYYRVRIHEITASLHRDLPPAKLWSYGDTLAPILIEARSNEGVLIEWTNDLPAKHILPLDTPMQGMPHSLADAPETRTVTHMHGASVPSISDGYPEDWFGPGHSKLCFYPNRQDATTLWMHDHAMGVSRLNVFAGLMGFYLIRDEHEATLNLPTGPHELPLLLYDRSFDPNGQLFYPNPPDEGAWAQEFLGDAMVVNGKVQPFHPVEPRRYRLRIANTANSRFFSLGLSNGQSFHVIGSDQGLLPVPVEMKRLVLAPAERTDLIVDFSRAPGQHIRLVSDSLELVEFRVSSTPVEDTSQLPATLRPVPRIPESQAVRTRLMTLNEFDQDNGEPMVMLLNRKHWAEPVTETVKLGSTEIWSLINLTEDTHPIHLHLVRFQLLDRQSISTDAYLDNESVQPTGPVLPPAPHEMGWKDVIQCPSGTVTRIIIPFEGYAGRYLWHCHILEHEANDMMRPYDVIA